MRDTRVVSLQRAQGSNSSIENDVGDEATPLPSERVSAEDLATKVERAAAGMNHSALVQATGLSSKTLRDILTRRPRSFGRVTLNKLDAPLGWKPGTAWDTYQAQTGDDVGEMDRGAYALIAEQMERLQRRVAVLEEQPGWATELIEVMRGLSATDRASVLGLARRLADS